MRSSSATPCNKGVDLKKTMDRREFLQQSVLATAFSLSSLRVRAFSQVKLERKGLAGKVIIVGAGLAGLSAAYELTRAGHDVTVLEAQARAGGRVFTLRAPFSDNLYAEAGAMFIPDTHDLTLHYVKEFNLPLEPRITSDLAYVTHVRGKRVVLSEGASVKPLFNLTPEEQKLGMGGLWQKCEPESVYQELGNPADPNWSVATVKKYDQMSYHDFLRSSGASEEAVSLMTYGWRDIWGEGLGSVSALTILRDKLNQRNSREVYIIRGGNDLLPKAFAERLVENIRYGSPVVKVEHNARHVRVIFMQAGRHQSIEADRLIFAIPFSVLRRVEVSPRFSPEKQRAVNELPYFSAARVSLQSRKRFWVAAGLNGLGQTDLPIANLFDMTSNQPGLRGILQSYLGGARARQVAALKESGRISFVLEQAEKVFPGIRENFEVGVSKCWDEDEWERGASSWYKPGQMSQLWPHIARPEGRVHFAGDHTSAWIRWMQGALHSGNRVAREVNDAL
jgi:monoamine oxidase